MTSAIMRRDLVWYYSLWGMLLAIMVTAWLCHDTNRRMAFERMIVKCFKDTFTFRLDDVPCCVWESPDSECTLKQAKLPRLGWFVP